MKGVAEQAQKVAAERQPADANNPFLFAERLWADKHRAMRSTPIRDIRDAMYEMTFLGIYSSPAMLRLGEKFAFERTRKDPKALRYLPEVQSVLLNVDRGGFEEAVIRMLILMAESRATVRRDRLERSARVLGHDEPFASLGADKRAALIHEQSLIVEFEPERALETLPDLLSDPAERQRAIEVVEFIAGAIEEMEPATIQLVQRFHSALGLKGLALPGPRQDPLRANGTVRDEFGEPAPLTAVAPLAPEAVVETDPAGGAGEAERTRPRARSGGIACPCSTTARRGYASVAPLPADEGGSCACAASRRAMDPCLAPADRGGPRRRQAHRREGPCRPRGAAGSVRRKAAPLSAGCLALALGDRVAGYVLSHPWRIGDAPALDAFWAGCRTRPTASTCTTSQFRPKRADQARRPRRSRA